jgi:hypothetical protein
MNLSTGLKPGENEIKQLEAKTYPPFPIATTS